MDPLAAVIGLLRPRTVGAKIISGAGAWAVRYERVERAGFGLVLAGRARLAIDGALPFELAAGDFVLMPATPGFTMASDDLTAPVLLDPETSAGLAELRHGDPHGDADFRMLGGFFRVEPANAALLGDLLPALVHIRGAEGAAKRLADTIALAADEALAQRPGRDLIVERLVEVVLVEALRFCPDGFAVGRPGLLDGLADPQLARALRRLHADPAAEWTVASLAREAGLSRSSFSDRFMRKVGLAPMAYLMQWRIALAKDMLQRAPVPLETVAARIGYRSASAFSTAFRRLVGQPPSLFARVPPGSSDARQEVAYQR